MYYFVFIKFYDCLDKNYQIYKTFTFLEQKVLNITCPRIRDFADIFHIKKIKRKLYRITTNIATVTSFILKFTLKLPIHQTAF